MQKRHHDRRLYFSEMEETCRKYYIPYLQNYISINQALNVLEVGCGDGGNLLPFAELGCKVTGVDIRKESIDNAIRFYGEKGVDATFICSDIFKLTNIQESFDLVIIHDVIEHISDKEGFIIKLSRYLTSEGKMFVAFPAWDMPFGGHQQICRSRILSKLPFVHLLPKYLYRSVLKSAGESISCIDELLDIKDCKMRIEAFERLVADSKFKICDRQLYFINPHYEVKFDLKPRKLPAVLESIPYVRNLFSTSCFYILQ